MARIALYSHDAQGLGHVRRSLAIAAAVGELRPRPDVLVIAGADEAAALPRPQGCDVLGLPALTKQGSGRYAARHLGLSLPEMLSVRGATMSAALEEFAPDLLVVDRHPRGIEGELEPALAALSGRTRVVLGLRDVLDDHEATADQWRRERSAEALSRWYDEVWIYGDRRVHDPAVALDLPTRLESRVHYTGYLANGRDRPSTGRPTRLGRTVLGLVGGGSDGGDLARAFAAAALPAGVSGVLVLGPQMPAAAREGLHAGAAGRTDLTVTDFVSDMAPLLDSAVAAVTMGGYNTVCEMLARGTPTLVVPRVRPRTEQLIRASRLSELGLLDVLTPDLLSPGRLTDWLTGAVKATPTVPGKMLDLDGLVRVRSLVERLLARTEETDVAV